MATPQQRRAVVITAMIASCVTAVAIHQLQEPKGCARLIDSDIHHIWKEGRQLSDGINP